MGNNAAVDEQVTCIVGYAEKPATPAWLLRMVALKTRIERLVHARFTHCSVSTDMGVLKCPPSEGEALVNTLAARGDTEVYDMEFCRFADGFPDNSYKMIQVARIRHKAINGFYATIYVNAPVSSFGRDNEKEDSIARVYGDMGSILDLEYGFATERLIGQSPSSYFVDEAKGRGYSAIDKINTRVWQRGHRELGHRVRAVYECNVFGPGHLGRLGGVHQATESIVRRIPGATIRKFGDQRLLLFTSSEAQRSALKQLLEEHDLLMK